MKNSKKQPYQIYYNNKDGNTLIGEIKKPSLQEIMQKIRQHSGHVNANSRNIKINNHARNNQIIVTLKSSSNNTTFVVSLPESLHHLIK